MKKSLLRPLTTGLALALATGLSSAYAAPDAPAGVQGQPAPQAAPHHPHGKMDGERGRADMRDGIMIPGIGPLSKSQLDALNLTAAQQKEVDAVRADQRDAHEAMRTAHEARRAAMSKQLADGKLDPHALAKEAEQSREKSHKQMQDVQAKGLAIWDSLDATQRTKVTEFVKAREEKMQARHDKRDAQHKARADGTPTPPPPAKP